MRALGLNHLAVVVRDLARAEVFYAGVLGLPVLARWDDEKGFPRSVWVGIEGGMFLALEREKGRGAPRDDGAPGWHCVAFDIAVTEREAWKARLEAAGHPIERETDYTLYTRDPDGNLVALSHHPERCVSRRTP